MAGETGAKEGCVLTQRTEWKNPYASILKLSQGYRQTQEACWQGSMAEVLGIYMEGVPLPALRM